MTLQKYALIAISLILIIGCKIQKDTASSSKLTEAEYIDEGYSRAVIVHFPENKEHCTFLIKKEDGRLLEPMDLDAKYQKAQLKVWIKYNPQRRPSRCEGTTPIGITEIQVAR